jgi:hypothetical protein
MLTRFARTDQLYPAGVAVPRLEAVVDILLEAEAAWGRCLVALLPEREVSARRHLGDYTLFMTGVFRERVEAHGLHRLLRAAGASVPTASSPSTIAPARGRPPPEAARSSLGCPSSSRATPGRSTTRGACTFREGAGPPFFRLGFHIGRRVRPVTDADGDRCTAGPWMRPSTIRRGSMSRPVTALTVTRSTTRCAPSRTRTARRRSWTWRR